MVDEKFRSQFVLLVQTGALTFDQFGEKSTRIGLKNILLGRKKDLEFYYI